MNRRNFLRNASLITAGTAALPQANSSREERSGSDLSVVFLSDVHVKPTEVAESGMRAALRHINASKVRPDFIINGGDAIMDAMAADKASTQAQWEVWNRVLQAENRLPVHHVIGNHDVWGWQVANESVKSDPLYEKAWVLQQHKMPGRFYSFQNRGWKFIVLDSTQPNGGGYIARLDGEQYAWLEAELKATPADRHVCIVSHIPIVSFCAAMFFDDHLPNGDWKLSRALLHVDARRLTQLFAAHPNVRCCLSGHIHLQDAVEYKNVRYFCNGAVSGNWWNGAFKGFEPAYARFRFRKDATVSREMISYRT